MWSWGAANELCGLEGLGSCFVQVKGFLDLKGDGLRLDEKQMRDVS